MAALSLLWLAGCSSTGTNEGTAVAPVYVRHGFSAPRRVTVPPVEPNNPPPSVRNAEPQSNATASIAAPAQAQEQTSAQPPEAPPAPVAQSQPQPPHSYIPARVQERYPLTQAWIPLKDWCDANKFTDFKRTPSAEGPLFSFNVPNGTVVVQTGNQAMTWCGVTLYLGWGPQLIGGHPYLAALDIRKNLEPLLGMTPLQTHGPVIVLDAGHGGSDNGTRSVFNGHPEKEFTLDVVFRLKALLNAQGWTVFLTRSNDVFMDLPERRAFADAHKAGVFLSVHFNSDFPQTTESGLETYCIPPRGMPSKLSRGGQDSVTTALPNNAFDSENIVLAERIHRSLLNVNGHLDRGVRRARFMGMLKWETRPAVLVECGYLSNPAEARRIADPAYRQRLAEAIAAALKPELPVRQIVSAPAGLASNSVAPAGTQAGAKAAPTAKNP